MMFDWVDGVDGVDGLMEYPLYVYVNVYKFFPIGIREV